VGWHVVLRECGAPEKGLRERRGKMARYVLNSAVVTAPGRYRYRLVSVEEARDWARRGDFISAIGYEETAQALGSLLGVEIPVQRIEVRMEPGDEALVFRLRVRPEPGAKGNLGQDFLTQNAELGILTREE
jgi:hypothetical protein